MPTTQTPISPEEIASWDTYDSRIRDFINPIWVEIMHAASVEMKQYAESGRFGDDDTDYITTTTDAINIITFLAYEGTSEDLSYFLFDTDLDDESRTIMSLRQIDSAGGAIHGCPSLAPFLARIREIEIAEEGGRTFGELSRSQ